MSWTRCSKLALGVGLALVLVAGTLGATAVPFESDVPESAQVGEEVVVEEIVMTDPFAVNDSDPWTMRVSTALEEPRLGVRTLDGGDNVIQEIDQTEDTAVLTLNETSISEVVFEVRGGVPEIGDNGLGAYSYENRESENVTVLEVEELFENQSRTVDNGTFELHRFTPDSQNARDAIDSASEAAEDADSDEARDRIDEAVTFYENGEFSNAISAANDAEDIADSGGGTRGTLILVGGVVALLVAIGGVAYYLRSRQDSANKLQ